MNKEKKRPVPSKRGKELERKINEAVREALLDHQRAGNPVAVWQNGKVVIVPPSKIPDLLTISGKKERKSSRK